MSEIIKLVITETYKTCPSDKNWRKGEIICETFEENSEFIQYLINRYGKLPHGKNKIYMDDKDGNSIEVGFIHSLWNKDWSHNTKPWFQQDWIEFWKEDNSRTYFELNP